jgi:hypothetical protein
MNDEDEYSEEDDVRAENPDMRRRYISGNEEDLRTGANNAHMEEDDRDSETDARRVVMVAGTDEGEEEEEEDGNHQYLREIADEGEESPSFPEGGSREL